MVQNDGAEPRHWSVAAFEGFWSNPNRDLSIVPAVLTPDVVGYWPGLQEPVRGRIEYMRCISTLVEALPDMRLTVAEHAASADFVFVRWIMHAIGANGPFELTGIDQVRTRDGQVCENFVVFDTAAFQTRSGKTIPWA